MEENLISEKEAAISLLNLGFYLGLLAGRTGQKGVN